MALRIIQPLNILARICAWGHAFPSFAEGFEGQVVLEVFARQSSVLAALPETPRPPTSSTSAVSKRALSMMTCPQPLNCIHTSHVHVQIRMSSRGPSSTVR